MRREVVRGSVTSEVETGGRRPPGTRESPAEVRNLEDGVEVGRIPHSSVDRWSSL